MGHSLALTTDTCGDEADQTIGDQVARSANNRHQDPAPRRKRVAPKTPNQKLYWEAIPNHNITFGIGPAGSGKTYLAVAQAVESLQKGEVEKIILTRPAVEAGEHFGYLPGTLGEKIDPYLQPLTDAMKELVGREIYGDWMAEERIVVAPLAFMRGTTMKDAFVILDEAQNTTPAQMKMFLTRFGYGTRMVITGDGTQTDLPKGEMSGLWVAEDVLDGVEGVAFVDFDADDVVRHPMVGLIVKAYEEFKPEPRASYQA